MKFSDGFWRNREGVSVYCPVEIYDYERDEQSLTVYTPYFHISNRGQTLQGPLLTIRISSPLEGVIGVQVSHFTGGIPKGPSFEIRRKSDLRVETGDTGEYLFLKSGNLSVRLNKASWAMEFYDGARRLTDSANKNLAYIKTSDNHCYIREQLALSVGECVYGLGERFTPFVKNGQVVEVWNADGGTSSELAYKNIPFYITNKGYGVFVNDPGRVSFEVGSEKVSRVQFSVPGEYLEYYVIGGSTPKETLALYTELTGRPALPPAWSFGLWLTTSFVTNYDEETVTGFIDGMTKRDLPLHVFHFDCFWMREFNWCDFEWDRRQFPEPEPMLKRLKTKGLKICVWINPYIAQRSKLFAEGKAGGYLVKKPNGDVWQCDDWQPGMGIVDFTNPEACRWYASKLRELMDMGVDCFKTDFGERIPTDVVYFDGSDPEKMHNYYTFLYNRVVFEALKEKYGAGNALVFARSATAGGQQFPVHWGGDCTANYESMAETLRGGLSLGICGFGFWSHDISGFEHTATPDLYKRWTAFGLLSSHSRLHGNMSYRVPWLFDEEAVDVLRFFTKLKCRLMPYLFAAACEAARTGVPVMRAMVLEFSGDPLCGYLDRQYMLGESLLVAPIFNEEGIASYYLPKGCWTNFLTGETVEGGLMRNEHHDYLSIPLLVRENSLIAIGAVDTRPDYDYAAGVELHLFELQNGCTARTVVYNTAAEPELNVTARRDGEKIGITFSGTGKPWSLLLRGIHAVKTVSGAACEADSRGIRIKPENNQGKVEVVY